MGKGRLVDVRPYGDVGPVEAVEVDELGPKLLKADGSLNTYPYLSCTTFKVGPQDHGGWVYGKPWPRLSSTEKEVLVNMVGKRNLKVREAMPASRERPFQHELLLEAAGGALPDGSAPRDAQASSSRLVRATRGVVEEGSGRGKKAILEFSASVAAAAPEFVSDDLLGCLVQAEAAGELATGSVDALVDALEAGLSPGSGAAVRAAAARGLGALRVESAVDQLGALLADPHTPLRAAALEALGRIGGKAAAYAHTIARHLAAPMCRRDAIVALARLGDEGAAFSGELVGFLEDSDSSVRLATVRALGGMWERLPSHATAEVDEVLRRQLSSASDRTRAAGATSVGFLGRARAAQYEDIVASMSEADPALLPKCAATIALGRLGVRVGAVAKYLQHRLPELRAAACEALALVELAQVVEHSSEIRQCLRDDHEVVRSYAMRAFGSIKHLVGPEEAEPLEPASPQAALADGADAAAEAAEARVAISPEQAMLQAEKARLAQEIEGLNMRIEQVRAMRQRVAHTGLEHPQGQLPASRHCDGPLVSFFKAYNGEDSGNRGTRSGTLIRWAERNRNETHGAYKLESPPYSPDWLGIQVEICLETYAAFDEVWRNRHNGHTENDFVRLETHASFATYPYRIEEMQAYLCPGKGCAREGGVRLARFYALGTLVTDSGFGGRFQPLGEEIKEYYNACNELHARHHSTPHLEEKPAQMGCRLHFPAAGRPFRPTRSWTGVVSVPWASGDIYNTLFHPTIGEILARTHKQSHWGFLSGKDAVSVYLKMPNRVEPNSTMEVFILVDEETLVEVYIFKNFLESTHAWGGVAHFHPEHRLICQETLICAMNLCPYIMSWMKGEAKPRADKNIDLSACRQF